MRRVLLIILGLALVAGGLWLADFCQGWTFPNEIEVVYSRCRDVDFKDISPGGRYMLAATGFPNKELFLIEIETNIWTRLSEGTYDFINDDLMLFWQVYPLEQQAFLYSIQGEEFSPLTRIEYKEFEYPETVTPDFTPPLDFESDWQTNLAEADQVFAVREAKTVVALTARLGDNSEIGFTLGNPFSGGGYYSDLEEAVLELGVGAQLVEASFRKCQSAGGCWSHNRQYLAKGVQVYNSDGEVIASQYVIDADTGHSGFTGWTHDDSGLYFNFGRLYLIESGIGIWPPLFPIPRAALKLKVP